MSQNVQRKIKARSPLAWLNMIDFLLQAPGDKSNGNDDIAEDEDEEDYDENLMEVQPDIIMNDGDDHEEHFDSIVEEEGVDPIQGHS